ncbi:uncharacterized protein LOC141812447 [Curcuma longa]|uniref:uncharacterized protein LOC141812447 n=1 Tax=Curcuma longa TaxID=136217 RepID=UPI003D9E4AE0
MAGLTANLAKSCIYMAGIDETTRQRILQITGFQLGEMPFRYLGIPIASQKLRISDYTTLLDALSRRVTSWPKATLSYAGKAQLVASVLQGVECYWMSVLPIPSGVVDRIYGICRSFMWTMSRPPIAWMELCRPRREGGLGLRDLSAWNHALLAKVLWRLQDKQDTLWIRWVHHTYLQQTDVWGWTARHGDSPLLKQILHIRDSILETAGSPVAAEQLLSGWFQQPRGVARHMITLGGLDHYAMGPDDMVFFHPAESCFHLMAFGAWAASGTG